MTLTHKTAIFFTLLAAVVVGAMLVIGVLSFEHMYLSAAKEQARTAGEMVRVHLTEAMINGTVDKRKQFFDRLHDVKDFVGSRVSRGPGVIQQYGPGILEESKPDTIDQQVIQSGKPYFEVVVEDGQHTLRATIPYIAEAGRTPNCMQCHTVQAGTVLGAITLYISIEEQRRQAAITIGILVGVVGLFCLGAAAFALRTAKPLIAIADQLQKVMDKAQHGDYSGRIKITRKNELGKIATNLNELLGNLNAGLEVISNRVSSLIRYNMPPTVNILGTTIEMVDSLCEVSRFKQAIEEDETTTEVYSRLAEVLRETFLLDHFAIYEVSQSKNRLKRIPIYSADTTPEREWCNPMIMVRADTCRAKRTGHTVDSVETPGICAAFHSCHGMDGCHHICIPVIQSGSVGSVVQLITNSLQSDLLHRMLPFIQIYLRESAPVLESKRLMETLRESTMRDPMTGLHNRRFLQEYVETLTSYSDRHKAGFTVLMADLDFFKQVNDTYGHEAGDATIKQLANIFRETLRSSDLIIRYGGEEFLILLRDTTQETALETAEKLRQAVERAQIQIPGGTIRKTLSIGLAHYPSDSPTFWQTVKYADVALYKAKETGRNKVIAFTSDMWQSDASY
jgi:diguanylate cyclase (GGDEF)-like protein